MNHVLLQTDFKNLRLIARGKVRDIYDLGMHFLLVTSDRISAFDVIMNEGIPGKGRVLNQISAFWFRELSDIVPNHMVSTRISDYPAVCQPYAAELEGRSMLVRKAMPLPVECIVRGNISGSGWKDYLATGHVCGIKLPTGLRESDYMETPIFTPSTKAELGTHDENISFDAMADLIGDELAVTVRRTSLQLFEKGRKKAAEKGIIIADTKFEFGLIDGQLVLIDEALTPDSSRFWPANLFKPGGPQPSFDKQFLRDYLETLDWDKKAPAPPLPAHIIEQTAAKYEEALVRLTA